MNKQAEKIIAEYELNSHPEGGYYKEIFRSEGSIRKTELPQHGDQRNFMTSILFLLNQEDKSHFHRLKSDEIWYFHAGGSAMIHFLHPNLGYYHQRIGLNSPSEDQPQVIIPSNTWFAAEVLDKNSFIFVGCAVAPGFDFRDFELGTKQQLIDIFPDHKDIVHHFTPR